jgi:ribosomal protein S18 acetylase RimI-like enzyme
MSAFSIVALDSSACADEALESLLKLVYVGGGFTEPSLADASFAGASVRARGDVFVARDSAGNLLGSVVVVPSRSPASRFAVPGEAELHLLCVHPEYRGNGIGSALVNAAIDAARRAVRKRMMLWTQPSMTVAQVLYRSHGLRACPL